MSTPRLPVEIRSGDETLRGWLYLPAEEAHRRPLPCVAMAHGFSGVKELVLPRYAEVLAAAGHAVVLFDHPGFGASDGMPRQHVDPPRQLAGYRAVLDWAAAHPELDRERLGVWGTSLSGGHALSLAALDQRVRAAVAQVPYVRPPLDEVPAELLATVEAPGGSEVTIPVVTSEPGGGGFLSSDPGAHAFFTAFADQAPSWRNEVTLASVVELLRYRPLDHCPSVHAPVLVLAAIEDVLCPIEAAREAFAALGGDCELVEIPTGHFGVYDECFDLASEAAAEWFTRWLGPG